MDTAREAHWQAKWAAQSLGSARRLPGREKFYALVAYPGASGFLHLGHLRGLVYADALHRYHRAMGHATFFPTGTHASGLPSVTFAQKVERREPGTVAQLEQNGVPPERWRELEDPAAAARFLGLSYLGVYRRLGFLIDERAYVTTIDEDYQRFIGWQFRRLKERGALVQAPHFASVCPVCGPVSVDPSETDLTTGGDADWVEYETVPFRLDDGRVLLAATLRAETVYGVTNLWLRPGESLVNWHYQERTYLVHRSGGERLVEQHGGRLGHPLPAEELVGRRVAVPLTGRTVPILSSALVDPRVGTGVVMSVPAHAPADWLALQALSEEARRELGAPPELLEPIPEPSLTPSERSLLSGSGVPAARAAAATGARSLDDLEALEEATERLYRLEHQKGRMRPEFSEGLPVGAARAKVSAALRASGDSYLLQEFSKPVVCRNGHAVIIQKVPDQWFLRYGDPAWKASARELARRMRFFPAEYGSELTDVFEWFQDRPCVRRGKWLGTPFPFDPTWVIEPIADSTFYPAYFVVRPFVTAGRLTVAQLTDAFFDLVLLGEGDGEPTVPEALQREVREEFLYWYPLDMNIGGKEHKRVHFPVFLYTHAKLLPEPLWPRAIFVNWWLTRTGGEKISKRHIGGKGGDIPPIGSSIETSGADSLRLFHATAASPHQDIEWDPTVLENATARLHEVERLARDLLTSGAGAPPELERWLSSEIHRLLLSFHDAYREGAIRDAAEIVYVGLPSRFKRYRLRGGEPGPFLEKCVLAWVRMMGPVTPHLAEELGEGRFDSLVAEQPLPRPDDFEVHPESLAVESFLDQVEEDLRSVLKPAAARGEHPTSATFYVAAPWKSKVEAWVREAVESKDPRPLVRVVMERAKGHPEVGSALSQVPKYVERVGPLLRSEPPRSGPEVDEEKTLRAAEAYLARRLGFSSVLVVRETEAEAHDPMGRRDRARPGRPAFYLSATTFRSS